MPKPENLTKAVSEGLAIFLGGGAKRMDFNWGTIYWVGLILRIDIKMKD